jgi:hypothetical protein
MEAISDFISRSTPTKPTTPPPAIRSSSTTSSGTRPPASPHGARPRSAALAHATIDPAAGTVRRERLSAARVEFPRIDDPRLTDRPGFGKVALGYVVLPYGAGSILTTETRVALTDDEECRTFRRYWALIGPGARFIMGRALRLIKADAERPGWAPPRRCRDDHQRPGRTEASPAVRQPRRSRSGHRLRPYPADSRWYG